MKVNDAGGFGKEIASKFGVNSFPLNNKISYRFPLYFLSVKVNAVGGFGK